MVPSLPDEAMMDVRQDNDGESGSSAQAFRMLVTDARGNLVSTLLPLSAAAGAEGDNRGKEQNLIYRAKGQAAAKGDLAVQRVATGTLQSRSHVMALARRDGSIDVVDTSSTAEGEWLLTLRNPDMKKGMHRWVGLAIASDGLYACTSTGDMRYFPIGCDGTSDQSSSSSSSAKVRLTHDESQVRKRELPEPLQHLVFEPLSNPQSFAYGGEEVPLSVWDVEEAFSKAASADGRQANHTNGDGASETPAGELSGKQKKRKRQLESRAKAAELQQGEVWRAKNLPNDALSLPQRAEIMCVVSLGETRWAVGTKSGLVRIYDTSVQRKYTKEFRVFDNEKAPVKHLLRSYAGTELIASDTAGRIFVVDWRSGAVLYQYKGIHESINALRILPPALSEHKPTTSYLVSASAGNMLRLHSVPLPTETEAEDEGRKMTKRKGAIIGSLFMRDGVTSIAWDGVVPQAASDERHSREQRAQATQGSAEAEHDGDDDDEVWDEMPTVEGRGRTTVRNGNGHVHSTDDEEEDEAAAKDERSKRRR